LRFEEADIPGMYLIELELLRDERGFFARAFDRDAFAARGLESVIVQSSISQSQRRGTLRGLHYQVDPAPEAKLVRCTRGAIHDVVVDLRPDSPMHLRHVAMELRDADHRMLYIPKYCAHGFQTLIDDTEILYQMDVGFAPSTARTIRYDDPQLALEWPLPVTELSDKDRSAPLLAEIEDPLS
jgi:dTDP-4-dehydrorhamnose 3,5-epimerase